MQISKMRNQLRRNIASTGLRAGTLAIVGCAQPEAPVTAAPDTPTLKAIELQFGERGLAQALQAERIAEVRGTDAAIRLVQLGR